MTVLALAAGLTLGCASEEKKMKLDLGSEHLRELPSEASHGYELDLEAGQFVRVVVEQQGIDVAVELFDPDGQPILRVDSPNGRQGPETVVAVAAASGTHRLRVAASEPEAPAASYRLVVEDRHAASEEERRRAAAELTFSQAEELRRQATKESLLEARDLYQEALAVFQALEDQDREADAHFRMGLVYTIADGHETALDHFETALARYRTAAARRREAASTLNYIGLLYRDLNRDEEAWRYFEEAQEIALDIGARDVAAAAFNNLGLVHRRRGETEKALTAYERALQLWRELKEPRQEIQALGNIGGLLTAQGKLEEAADQLNRALEILAVHKDPRMQAIILGRRGEVRKRQDRLEEAASDLEQALDLWRRIGNSRRVAIRLNSMGTVHLLSGDRGRAKECYDEALAMYRELGERRGEGIALHNLGRLHLPNGEHWPGEPRKALEYFDAAVPFLEELGDPQVEASNLYGSAQALHDMGEYEAARKRLEGSLKRVEELRTEAGGESLRIAFFATKQHYYDLYIDVSMHLDEKEPEAGHDVAAFEMAERRRGRALLDLLGESAIEIRQGVDSSLLDEEERIQGELNALERRRLVLSRQSPRDKETLAGLEQAERQKRSELDRIRFQIRQAGSRFVQVSPQPRSLEEIRTRLLDRRSILLSYALGEERSFLWQVSREAFRSHVLPGRREIEKKAGEAHELLQSRRHDAENPRKRILEQLGDVLLGPVAADLGQRRRRLLIVAEGNLLYVPFAALTEPGRKQKEPLVARHETVNLPSASIMLALREELGDRQPASRPIAVLADPVFSPEGDDAGSSSRSLSGDLERSAASFGIKTFPPLPHTREEAEEICKLFGDEALEAVGFEASKDTVLEGGLDEYQILHFATHGLLNREHPELSGLVLSLFDENGRPRDGFLRLHEIYQLHLQAELVVLSACQTGLGQEARGEGMLGLTRGFMYAGAPRVMVSQWKVGDQSTAELMKRFYWALTQGAASPSMALRAAQLSMLEEETWSHPYHWAPFVLQGEWRLPGETDDDIEKAAVGSGSEDEEDTDLPTPPFCKDLPDEWAQKLCRILYRLRAVPGRVKDQDHQAKRIVESTETVKSADILYFNGIDGVSSEYFQPPLVEERLARTVVRIKRDWAEERDLLWSNEKFKDRGPDRRPMPDVDPKDLASSGWGVIFSESTPPAVRDALRPLLQHRKEQATQNKKKYYRELVYKSGDTKQTFFRRYEVEPGPAHPEQLPYYLLIVGGPEAVPQRFQYLLDLQYAVGRIHFDDVASYEHYAHSVIRAEAGDMDVSPEAVFFPVQHDRDKATRRTFQKLVQPLTESLAKERDEWSVRTIEPANKADLERLLGGGETPAFLFTSAHGLRLPSGHPRQTTHQGAVVCSDWQQGPVDPEYCFAAPDLEEDARLCGLIAFLFGCFSAGTPRHDNFPLQAFRSPILAPKPMIAPLPQRLLGHPEGGALAVLGHVDRAWTRSFSTTEKGMGYLHFLALLKYLLDGHPLGSAMDWMNERFAELSTELTDVLDERKEPILPGGPPEVENPKLLASLWRANNDARNFVVLGDPAVRLAAGPRARHREAASSSVLETQLRKDSGSEPEHLKLKEVLGILHTRDSAHLSISPAEAVRAERRRHEE